MSVKYHVRVSPQTYLLQKRLIFFLVNIKSAQQLNVPMSTFDFSHVNHLTQFITFLLLWIRFVTLQCNTTFSAWLTDVEFILLGMKVIFKLTTKISLCMYECDMCALCMSVCKCTHLFMQRPKEDIGGPALSCCDLYL